MRIQEPEQMTRNITGRITGMVVKGIVFLIIAIFVFGEAVYHLWNWLAPSLFHLPAVTFWQAVGLLALSWLLFGGLRGFSGAGRGHRGRWQHRMKERWEQMTPEEREKFRESMQGRCGQVSAEAQPKP
jgi:hypothetical protein